MTGQQLHQEDLYPLGRTMAEAMATVDSEDLSGYFSMQYRQNLLLLLK